jgi:hypothetical protein
LGLDLPLFILPGEHSGLIALFSAHQAPHAYRIQSPNCVVERKSGYGSTLLHAPHTSIERVDITAKLNFRSLDTHRLRIHFQRNERVPPGPERFSNACAENKGDVPLYVPLPRSRQTIQRFASPSLGQLLA